MDTQNVVALTGAMTVLATVIALVVTWMWYLHRKEQRRRRLAQIQTSNNEAWE